MPKLSHENAETLRHRGWNVFNIAIALLVLSIYPITFFVMVAAALVMALSGQKGREKVKKLGINPWNWLFGPHSDVYSCLIVLVPLAIELGLLIALDLGVSIPALSSFYLLTFPALSVINWIGIGLLGAALLMGLAYWILKPSDYGYGAGGHSANGSAHDPSPSSQYASQHGLGYNQVHREEPGLRSGRRFVPFSGPGRTLEE